MAITTDAQRDLAVQLLQSGKVTDLEQKKALLAQVLAYDQQARRGEPPAGGPAVAELVQPAPSAAPLSTERPHPLALSPQELAERSVVNRAIGQGVTRFFSGAGDLFSRFFDRLSPEERAALREQRLQEQAEQDVALMQEASDLGMDPASLDALRTAGRMVPEVVAGGGAGLVRSRLGRVVTEGGLSGLFAFMSDPLAEDAASNALIWSGVGSTLGLVLEVPGFVRGVVLRDAGRALKARETREGFEAGNEFGVDLTLAEASLDEQVARIEQAVADTVGGPKREFNRKRQIQVSREFLRLADQLNPQQLSTGAIASTLQEGYARHVSELQRIATTNFRDALAEAADAVGARIDKRGRIIGGRPVLVPRSLIDEIESIMASESRVPLLSGPEDDVALKGVLEKMLTRPKPRTVTLPDGRKITLRGTESGPTVPTPLTLGELQILLERLTQAAYSAGGPVERNLTAVDRHGARNLLKALMEDIDTIVQRRPSDPANTVFVGPEGFAHPQLTDEVVIALQKARAGYARDKAPINALADTAFNTVLNKVGDMNSETFLRSIMALDAEDLQKVMRLADQTKPGLANAIRGRIFAGLVDRHTHRAASSTANAVVNELDFRGFAKEFAEMPASKLAALLPSGTDEALARRAQAGMAVILRIANGPNVNNASVRGIVQRIESFAINAASQNHFFISRLLAGELSPRWLEKLFYTKEGLRTLANLGDPRTKRAGVVAAINSMARMMMESDAEIEEARRAVAEQGAEQLRRQETFVPGQPLPKGPFL